MKKKSLRTAVCLLLVGTVLTAFVAIAAEVGSQGDPLVTLSYLNETFLGQVLEQVEGKLSSRNEMMRQEIEQTVNLAERDLLSQIGGSIADSSGGVASSYTAVELTAGQILYGTAGCEVMLRSGSVKCVSNGSTPGLVDATDGGTINNGTALKANHLYLMTAERGVKASGAATLLVRGEYTIQ